MKKKFISSDVLLEKVIAEFNPLIILSRKLGLNLSIDRSYITDSIEIWIRKSNGETLLELLVDELDFRLEIKKHRTEYLTKIYIGKKITKTWMANFLEQWSEGSFENKIQEYIKKTSTDISEKFPNERIYYVYRHTFENGYIYIGKGKNNRYLETTNGRSQKYLDLLKICGYPAIEILSDFLTEDKAYEIENELIVLHRENNLPVVNITDGLEFGGFGSMPWRTLMYEKYEFDQLDEKFKKIIHLMKKTNEEIYLIGFTVIEAAKIVKCSCNDIIKLLNSEKRALLNDYRIIPDEEAAILFPNYKSSIEKKEEMNLTYRVFNS